MTKKKKTFGLAQTLWRGSLQLLAVLFAVIVIAAGIYADRQNTHVANQHARAMALNALSIVRAKLEGNISSNIQLVRGLVSVISSTPEFDQTRIAALAENLIGQSTQLRSIAIAPNLVVSMTFPLKGNEKAIGLDYRFNLAQRDAVLRARDTGKLVLAGPVNLVQGGTGFLGRFPVFVGENKKFWGIVSSVVDMEQLYADSGLLDPDLSIEISIAGKDATGHRGTRFYGRSLANVDPVTAQVILPTGSWEISAIPKGGWDAAPNNNTAFRAMIGLVWALLFIPAFIVARLLHERQSHIRELGQRQIDLSRLSKRLGLALDTSRIGVWEVDLVTNELLWDDRMNEMYGWSGQIAPNNLNRWTERLHPDDGARALADFETGRETGEYNSEFRVVLPGGIVRNIRTMGSVHASEGENPRIVGVNWDVTADVALNEELKRANSLTEARNRELEIAKVRIEHTALHDSLTGLPNRRYLDELLQANATNGYDDTGSIGLLHIDLDRFKQINDTLGHAAGDAMLVHAAAVLRRHARPGDFVARIGGDEFVVVSSVAEGQARLAEMAEAIVCQMRQPVYYHGHECRFGVSIGIAVECDSELDVKRLLIDADIALYRAKARGRNRYEFFTKALEAEVVHTKRVADQILSGIEQNQFITFYQPQFCATSLDLIGVEALARWDHPTQGVLTPDRFLKIAEELNVVATLDRLVLEQTLADLAQWDQDGIMVPRASVNVSLRRLNDDDLIAGLRDLDIEPGRISFELVESIYLDEKDDVVGWNIDQLKELGIDIEIDDFGTGYASIVSLQKLRPKRLKIDRQLVAPVVEDPAQRRLVQSIVDIGKSLGIEVVAEGVETMAHACVLRDLGCDILQGYVFARPMSSGDLVDFLTAQNWRQAI
ncbi:EAL domain-containing protein [Devosia rhodophyticola]|uniref:EAL domain-containing protein n=1 Tax=Devosia rhodophyticola TaxID=3026423 RepID=A0ABY7Z0H4_9HYPH|nr:EAL domain-containing protein [Devosia rhodophyticola]WDR07027.1 EAL domain-containing protein [Devosia rhodophyticola]